MTYSLEMVGILTLVAAIGFPALAIIGGILTGIYNYIEDSEKKNFFTEPLLRAMGYRHNLDHGREEALTLPWLVLVVTPAAVYTLVNYYYVWIGIILVIGAIAGLRQIRRKQRQRKRERKTEKG